MGNPPPSPPPWGMGVDLVKTETLYFDTNSKVVIELPITIPDWETVTSLAKALKIGIKKLKNVSKMQLVLVNQQP